jgi:hypothetical protein
LWQRRMAQTFDKFLRVCTLRRKQGSLRPAHQRGAA